MQIAAAVPLALIAAKEVAVQDSARYLGVIPHLAGMVASTGSTVAEVGRLAILSLCHRNLANQAEIKHELRNHDLLLDDLVRFGRPHRLLNLEESRMSRLLDDLDLDIELSRRPYYSGTCRHRISSARPTFHYQRPVSPMCDPFFAAFFSV